MVMLSLPEAPAATSSVQFLDLVALAAADDAPAAAATYWARVVLRLAAQYPGFARMLAEHLPPSQSEDDLACRLFFWFPAQGGV